MIFEVGVKGKVKGIPLRSPLNKGGLWLVPPLFKGGATVRSGGDAVAVPLKKDYRQVFIRK